MVKHYALCRHCTLVKQSPFHITESKCCNTSVQWCVKEEKSISTLFYVNIIILGNAWSRVLRLKYFSYEFGSSGPRCAQEMPLPCVLRLRVIPTLMSALLRYWELHPPWCLEFCEIWSYAHLDIQRFERLWVMPTLMSRVLRLQLMLMESIRSIQPVVVRGLSPTAKYSNVSFISSPCAITCSMFMYR